MQWNITNLEEFTAATRELLEHISKSYSKDITKACVVCLHGNLGAGKTTMSQVIGSALGVLDNMQSPTFVIKKIYSTTSNLFTKLIHMDAYRLEDGSGITMLGLDEDFVMPGVLMLIEWPEMIENMIPDNAFHVFIDLNDQGRTIRLETKKA